MTRNEIRTRLRHFEALCREQGLPLTVQRRDILQTVLERNDHPTADQLYESLQDRIPGLSRTTVYRVLSMLVEMAVIRRLHHPGTTARFDGKIHRHHHLICRRCDKVIDVHDTTLDEVPQPDVRTEGFEIDDFSVHFTGICAECRNKA
ncbi:MAG: transcriptional repressor [Planctomycetes bacterium]|nr:transcriptional repressor [Planctomycetota bacterium]